MRKNRVVEHTLLPLGDWPEYGLLICKMSISSPCSLRNVVEIKRRREIGAEAEHGFDVVIPADRLL